jgi:hypothetical protein
MITDRDDLTERFEVMVNSLKETVPQGNTTLIHQIEACADFVLGGIEVEPDIEKVNLLITSFKMMFNIDE